MGTVRLNRILILTIVTVAVIALDQAAKAAVFSRYEEHRSYPVLGDLIAFQPNRNAGAAFGILGNVPGSAIILTVTTIATIVLLAVLFRKLMRTHLVTGCIALALIYGGAIGNLIDRIWLGKVRDFIELPFIKWPAFNVADMAIVAGIILLLFGLALMPAHRHAAAPEAAAKAPKDDAREAAETAPGAEKEA